MALLNMFAAGGVVALIGAATILILVDAAKRKSIPEGLLGTAAGAFSMWMVLAAMFGDVL